jgi:3-hydroxybutyryl-CoA dehydrogenase
MNAESNPADVPKTIQRLGVVGSGVMGLGIAQIALQAGLNVSLHDAREGAAAAGREQLLKTLAMLHEKGKVSAEVLAQAPSHLVALDALSGMADCDVVVEAILEQLEAKRQLMAQLEGIVSDACVLATNTSSLSVTAIAAGLRLPERVVGFHFFNPVPLMKVVEVIDGLLTAPEHVQTLLALGQRMGHTAVHAKDTPGFIVNHAGRGYGTEALRVLAEGVGSVEDIDRVLRETAGFRLGPFELMDLTGLDVSHPVMESIYHQYFEEPRYRPNVLTRQMLNAGVLGRKTSRGFYPYVDGVQQKTSELPESHTRPEKVWISKVDVLGHERASILLNALGAVIDHGKKPAPESLCVVTPLGLDVSSLAVAQGLDPSRTVGIDTLFDTSKRRVLMLSPTVSPVRANEARGLLGKDGVPVTVLQDSAGMVAARVVATIVNIACDMAQQGIASPEDIDRAVQLGLGYPFGPLAWGDRLGARRLLQILDELHSFTGDPRYRASPWLKRRALLGLSLLHVPPTQVGLFMRP